MKKSHQPTSWLEAFFMLSQLLESIDKGERQVVFLDDMPVRHLALPCSSTSKN